MSKLHPHASKLIKIKTLLLINMTTFDLTDPINKGY